jgi:hypothetical protein
VKKSLKTLALITATWSVAEFVTTWRMQNTRFTLKQFTKIYFKGQKEMFNASVAAGERIASGSTTGAKEEIKDILTTTYHVTP